MRRGWAIGFLLLTAAWCAVGATVDWSKAEEVQTGVLYLRFEETEPRLMKVNLMRVDLRTPGLFFTATGRDKDWGKPMPDYPKALIRTKRIRTRDFMTERRKPVGEGGAGQNLIVAANAAPWWPWEKPWNHQYGHPAGLGISEGEVVCDTRPHNAVFVVYKDGTIDIVSEVPEADYAKVWIAVSGFAVIMRDGEVLDGGGYEKPLMPRIAYGLSKDRDYLYIVTVDGRQKNWSLGATGRETAQWLLDAGAYDAINMDGGGSATLCYWDEAAGKPRTVNRQTEGGYERPVGSNIGIGIKK